MYLCKFSAEKPTGSEERAKKRLNLLFFKDDDLEMRWHPWQVRSRSPKSYQLYILSQWYDTLSLARIHCSNQEMSYKTLFVQNMTLQSAGVTLKIRSRSSISNQQLLFSQQCIYASLIKLHQLVQKIKHRNHIFDIWKCWFDLEN